MQNLSKDNKETPDNYENLYFKIFEFKEDFTNQIISNSDLVNEYYRKTQKIIEFHELFRNIEKNRQSIRDSNSFNLQINYQIIKIF